MDRSTCASCSTSSCARPAGAAVWAAVDQAPQQGLPQPGRRRQLAHETGRGQQRALQGWVRSCDVQCQCLRPSTDAHALNVHDVKTVAGHWSVEASLLSTQHTTCDPRTVCEIRMTLLCSGGGVLLHGEPDSGHCQNSPSVGESRDRSCSGSSEGPGTPPPIEPALSLVWPPICVLSAPCSATLSATAAVTNGRSTWQHSSVQHPCSPAQLVRCPPCRPWSWDLHRRRRSPTDRRRRRGLAAPSPLVEYASALTPSCRCDQHSISMPTCRHDPASRLLDATSLQQRQLQSSCEVSMA